MNKKKIILCSVLASFFVASISLAQSDSIGKLLGVKSDTQSASAGYGYDDGTVPDAPTDLHFINRQVHSAEAVWTAPTQEVTGYTIAYGLTTLTRKTTSVSLMATSDVLHNLRANSRYFAKIKSDNYDSSDSDYSSLVSFRTLPAKVRNLRIVEGSKTADSIAVRWKKEKNKRLTYQVRVRNAEGKIVRFKRTKKGQTIIRKLKTGKLYRIQVRAKFNKDNIGPWSKAVIVQM